MEIKLASKFGFCFGVKRAIKLTEKVALNKGSAITLGPLIHNPREIDRLRVNFNVQMQEDLQNIPKNKSVVIRTHGITKQNLDYLVQNSFDIIDATCPFVTKPQKIVEQMSKEGYQIVIFGDASHPEVKGIISYSLSEPIVVSSKEELLEKLDLSLKNKSIIGKKVALVSQTTKQPALFLEISNIIIQRCQETRIFNTICLATFENQDSIRLLSKEVDVMIIVGGLSSSNTKQLFNIAKSNCLDSYLIEDESSLQKEWFFGKKACGISAGASTPSWIIDNVLAKIKSYDLKD